MRHRHVLIAEDEEASLHLLKTTLVHWGYEVQVCRNGVDALQALEQPDSPEIALLDWMMPGLEGIEICRELRKTATGAGKYVMLLTTRSDKEDLIQGLRAGADDYIVKPFHLGELRARLLVGTRIISVRQALEEKVAELTTALEARRHADGAPGTDDEEQGSGPVTQRERTFGMTVEDC